MSPWIDLMNYSCLTEENSPVGLGYSLNFQWYKSLNESFLFIPICAGVRFPSRQIFIFWVIPPAGSSKQNTYFILLVLLCLNSQREASLRDCLSLNYLSSLGRAEEVLNNDCINKSFYSKYFHYFYTMLSSEISLCFYGIFKIYKTKMSGYLILFYVQTKIQYNWILFWPYFPYILLKCTVHYYWPSCVFIILDFHILKFEYCFPSLHWKNYFIRNAFFLLLKD